jgi:hypothetical protein
MRATLRNKAVAVCNDKIAKKGETVGLSFYAFLPTEMMIQRCLWKPPNGGSKRTNWITLRKRRRFEI